MPTFLFQCVPIVVAFALFLQPTSVGAARGPCPDPYVDPKNDQCNPLRYIPGIPIAVIAAILLISVGLLQTWLTFKHGAKFMLAMVIGCFTFGVGIGLRVGVHNDPHVLKLYIIQSMLVLLSPCAFIASTYALLGHLATYLECGDLLPLVRPRRITTAFVTSDVLTFLIQAGGGGMLASGSDPAKIDLGNNMFLGGLILQLISFIIFSVIFLWFIYRVYTRRPDIWKIDSHKSWSNDWRALVAALTVACVGIMIRSVFRTAEKAEGFGGPLSTSETMFYVLDTLPLFVTVAIFVPFWPGRFISDTPITKQDLPHTSVPFKRLGRDKRRDEENIPLR
ncbi:RTA1-domain-containing protein [Pleurotus eryngii]|uniref:RTA1-domain-containing protein n=1 Tax=Pleurotus eryngii TaxID=5323 RepID=A0A9P6A869_PLEER|nr:RTA1-domain-containing protein [Pleurotus eryngii]